MHNKEYVYFIPFEHCKIAGDMFTLLVIGQSEIDEKENILYWSSCERGAVCEKLGNRCFYANHKIDFDMPFDIGQMTDYILKNGNKIEYDHYDELDMLLFYLWEGKYSEQKLIKALQQATGQQYINKKDWFNWYKKYWSELQQQYIKKNNWFNWFKKSESELTGTPLNSDDDYPWVLIKEEIGDDHV